MDNLDAKTNIGIFGVGAIGTVISFGLKDIYTLNYFNRSPRNEISLHFEKEIIQRTIRLTDVNENELDNDCLFICVKEYHNEHAIPLIKKIVSPQTRIVVVRNGMLIKDPFLKFIPEDQIIECVIDCPTEEIQKGHYLQHKQGIIYTASSKLVKEVSNYFIDNRILVKEVNDFHTFKWKKLIESSSIGSIQTILGETCRLFKKKENLDLFKSILLEGINVGRADGAKIENSFFDEQVQKLLAYPENKGSSMLTDLLSRRPIEWRAKNGIISKIGKQCQIKTEMNDMLCEKLKQINQNLNSD